MGSSMDDHERPWERSEREAAQNRAKRRSDITAELQAVLSHGLDQKDAIRAVEIIEELIDLRITELKR